MPQGWKCQKTRATQADLCHRVLTDVCSRPEGEHGKVLAAMPTPPKDQTVRTEGRVPGGSELVQPYTTVTTSQLQTAWCAAEPEYKGVLMTKPRNAQMRIVGPGICRCAFSLKFPKFCDLRIKVHFRSSKYVFYFCQSYPPCDF